MGQRGVHRRHHGVRSRGRAHAGLLPTPTHRAAGADEAKRGGGGGRDRAAKAHLRDVVGGVVQQQAGAGGRGRRVRQVGRRHVGRMGAGRVVTRTSIVTVARRWYSSGSC